MIAEVILVFLGIILLTGFAPYWSLLLFVFISPWNTMNDIIGWDPRLGWSVLIAMRAAFEWRNPSQWRIPRTAVWCIVGFAAVAFLGLQIGNREIPADELQSARSIFLNFVIGLCASFAILQLTNTRRRVIQLLNTTVCSLLAASALGLFQASASYMSGQPSPRIPGTIGNPNYFAAYLSLGATCMVLVWRANAIHRHLVLIAGAIAVLTCVLTLSRMGIVACFLGIAMASLIKASGRLFNWKLVFALSLAVALSAGLALGYIADIRRSITYSDNERQNQAALLAQGGEDLSRLEALKFSWGVWMDNPVFGAGLSTIAARNYRVNGLFVTSHDTYLQILAGTGAAGGILILCSLISLIRSLPSYARRLMLPAIAQFCVCSFFGDYLQSSELFVLFSVLFALALSIGPNYQLLREGGGFV